mgnify:CR=1 FL=1|jgi:hypothetical protein
MCFGKIKKLDYMDIERSLIECDYLNYNYIWLRFSLE